MLDGQLQLRFDPGDFDREGRRLVLHARLVNTGDEPVYPPLTVTVQRLEDQRTADLAERGEIAPPRLENAVNGVSGVGAVFDFSSALGGFEALLPGAVTGAVPLVLTLPTDNPMVMIMAEVRAWISTLADASHEPAKPSPIRPAADPWPSE